MAMRSCSVPVSAADGKQITTIEGLAQNGTLHKVQQAWIDNDVPQCGYCQSGMIMAVAALAQGQAEADRRGHRPRNHQHLPLRHLSAGARGDPRRRERVREAVMNYMPRINRRSFVVGSAAAGGGLALGFDYPVRTDRGACRQVGGPEVNAWVVVRPDETVVIRVARSEMGQGTLTGLAQLVAEELECDWSKVTYEFPTPGQNVARKRVWGDFFTAGSRGIRASNEFVRKGGAAARMMLIQAAANEWKVPAAECTAANGVITHKASNRSTTYGKVADAAAKIEPPQDIKLKDPKDWKIIGKGMKRLDTPDKVDGKAIYGIDVRLPGMLYAAIKACPVNGGKVKSFDAAKITGGQGREEGRAGRGLCASRSSPTAGGSAKTALDALPIEWDEGPNAKVSSAIDRRVAEGRSRRRSGVCRQQGRRRQSGAWPAPPRRSRRSTAIPISTMSPWSRRTPPRATPPDKCEVWCSTQNGEQALATARKPAACRFRSAKSTRPSSAADSAAAATSQDYVRQAVLVAKEMPGTPVKLLWTREEDMTHGWYHPITQCKMHGRIRQGQQPDRAACAAFRASRFLATVQARAHCRTARTRRRSPASTRAEPKRRSAIRCPTSWSTIRCATRTSIRASGGA